MDPTLLRNATEAPSQLLELAGNRSYLGIVTKVTQRTHIQRGSRFMKSRSPIRNSLWLLIAVMAFFAMAASSPQCASSDDAALNPTLAPLAGGGNPCIDACNEESKARKRIVLMQKKACLNACNGEPGCRSECSIIADALMMEINEDRDACKLVCQHEQGAATGGQ